MLIFSLCNKYWASKCWMDEQIELQPVEFCFKSSLFTRQIITDWLVLVQISISTVLHELVCYLMFFCFCFFKIWIVQDMVLLLRKSFDLVFLECFCAHSLCDYLVKNMDSDWVGVGPGHLHFQTVSWELSVLLVVQDGEQAATIWIPSYRWCHGTGSYLLS